MAVEIRGLPVSAVARPPPPRAAGSTASAASSARRCATRASGVLVVGGPPRRDDPRRRHDDVLHLRDARGQARARGACRGHAARCCAACTGTPSTSTRWAGSSRGTTGRTSRSSPGSGRSSRCPPPSRARRAGAAWTSPSPRPTRRRSIALEKVAGHVAAIGIAMAVVALVAWVTGAWLREAPRRRDLAGRGDRLRHRDRVAGADRRVARLRPRAVPRARRGCRDRGRADARRLRHQQLPGGRAGVRHAWPAAPGSRGLPTTCRSPGSRTGRRSPWSPSSRSSCSRSASRRSRAATWA